MHRLTITVSQESKHDLTGSSGFRLLSKLWSSTDSTGEDLLLTICVCGCGRIQFFVGSEIEIPHELLAQDFLVSLTCGPVFRASHNMATCFIIKRARENNSKKQSSSKVEGTVFCNLIRPVTTLHFWHILFIRRKSLGPTHIQGKEITQGYAYQETRITGSQTYHTLV